MNSFSNRNRLLIIGILSALFVISSFSLYNAFNAFSTGVINYFSNTIYIIPPILDGLVLSLLFIAFLFVVRLNDPSKLFKGFIITFIVMISILSLALIINILLTTIDYGWKDMNQSSFHQGLYMDMITEVLMIGLFIYPLVISIKKYKKADYYKPVDTDEKPIKIKFGNVLYVTFMTLLVQTLTGIFIVPLHIFFEGYFDPNWYGIIPVIIMGLSPLACYILYFIYKARKNDKKFYLISLLMVTITLFVSCAWTFVVYIIHPRFIYESMQPFFPIGMAINIPLAPVASILFTIMCLLVASIKYLRHYHEKKNSQQKEIAKF